MVKTAIFEVIMMTVQGIRWRHTFYSVEKLF